MTATDRVPVTITDAAPAWDRTAADGERSFQVRFRLRVTPTTTYGVRATFAFDSDGFPSDVSAALVLEVPRIRLHRGGRRGAYVASVHDLATPTESPVSLIEHILPRHRLRADHPALGRAPVDAAGVAELVLEILTDACHGRRPSASGRPYEAAVGLLSDAALLLGVQGDIRLGGTHLSLHNATWPYRHLERRLQTIALALGIDAGASPSSSTGVIDFALAKNTPIPAPPLEPSRHQRMAAAGRLAAVADSPECARLLAPLLGGAI